MSRDFLHTVAWRVVAAGSTVATAMVSFKLYGRYLSPQVYGLVQSALVVVSSLPLFDGGFRTAVNRELLTGHDPVERRQLLDFTQVLNTWMAALALLLGMGAMMCYRLSPNARASGEPLSFFLALGGLAGLVLMASAQSNLLLGLGGQRQMFVLNALAPWINLLSLWWGFHRGWAVWSFVVSQLLTAVVVIVSAALLFRWRYPETPLFRCRPGEGFSKVFHRLKGKALQVLACQASTTLLYMADTVLVNALLFGPSVGHYALVTRLFTTLRSMLQSADEALWPLIASRAGKGTEMSQLLGRINGWVYGAMMTAAALTIPPFIRSYMGAEYAPSLALVGWMAFRGIITGLASQPAAYLFGTGRFPVLAQGMAIELGLGLVLGGLGAHFWGVEGLAAGFVAATLGGTLLPLPTAYARMHHWKAGRWLVNSWARTFVASIIAAGVAILVIRQAHSPSALVMCGGLAAGSALGIGVCTAIARGRIQGIAPLPALLRYL